MKFEQLKNEEGFEFKGPFLITPQIFGDQRGIFYESWNKSVFDININANVNFVQDNHSKSIKGVLRGLHYQTNPFPQGKLVRCISGAIFDVAIDLRKNSETFAMWIGVELSSENMKQLWIPEGFAHGFLTMSDFAEVLYKTTDYWSKDCEKSIKWDDKTLAINWPLNKLNMEFPILSKKDKEAISFKESFDNFD
nr:dTDP-4-dehydrorhamnose 3,5-epimerase [Prochlorococcus marinus]